MGRVLRYLFSEWEKSTGTGVKAFPGIPAGSVAECGFSPSPVQPCMGCAQSEQEPASFRLGADRGPAVCQTLCWAQGWICD